jgi:hypothetical protein
VLVTGLVQRGDAESALSQAVHRVTVETSTPFIEHAYIEPEAGWAERKGERIEVHGCTQAATMDREEIAAIMGLSMDAVRVAPSACGGGFGSKLDVSFQPYIALAAWRLGRPVAICYSRGESMRATTKRHPSEIMLTVGCDAQGVLSGFDFSGTFNTGAYASWGPTVANRVPIHASGPYYVPDYRVVRGVIANSKLVLTFKHHPIVFAQGELVPVVGVALDDYYSHKNKGAMSNTGHESLLVDAKDFFGDGIYEKLDEVIENNQGIREEISNWVGSMQQVELDPYRFALAKLQLGEN